MATKKADPSVLGSNIQPLDAQALAEAVGEQLPQPVQGNVRTIDPEVLAAAIAHVQAMQAKDKEPETAPAPRTVPNIREIILDPHDDIPPNGGLYVGYNGLQFLLPTNRSIRVPQGVVNVLDDAVLQVAVRDPDTLKYIGSRPAKRFQYRFTENDPGRSKAA